MKKYAIATIVAVFSMVSSMYAQSIKSSAVPAAVKAACMKSYPQAANIKWEKENGNYEANWGGKSGEDNAAQFTPKGEFVEIEVAIPVSKLAAAVISYVKAHNAGTIKEAAQITDAKGKVTYEAEVKGKDMIFDENGNFIKTNNGD